MYSYLMTKLLSMYRGDSTSCCVILYRIDFYINIIYSVTSIALSFLDELTHTRINMTPSETRNKLF